MQFGWFGFIAEPLFYMLRWMYHYIPNYGWAIVVMTVAINMLLYPLKVKSWRSMQKMQKVAPEIRSIQDRYKKYSMRDPRKQEMNKEVMAVYSREGINPMGSCLPQVVADAHLVRPVSHAERHHRIAPRAVVRLDSRSFRARPLLHPDHHHGAC